MIKFTVTWDDEVERPLIDAWIGGNSQTRSILTEIADWVDTALSRDPELKGRPREDLGARVIAVELQSTSANISVTYQVSLEDRMVRVILLTISV
jgi:hypothetical protein